MNYTVNYLIKASKFGLKLGVKVPSELIIGSVESDSRYDCWELLQSVVLLKTVCYVSL